MSEQENGTNGESRYFPVSPVMLFPETFGNFSVFLKQGDRYVLYAEQGEQFSEEHRKRMNELGVQQVHLLAEHKGRFRRYVEENLGKVLASETVPMPERAKIFYDASLAIVKGVFSSKLPASLSKRQLNTVVKLVKSCTAFLSKKDALKHLGGLISHDYKLYRHSVNVFVFTASLMETYDATEQDMIDLGVAAVLHDIGKQHIPQEVLRKQSAYTSKEIELVRGHPVMGVSMCAKAQVSATVLNAILFHHEKIDGSGYPSGLTGEDMPFPVKVLAAANAYDNLITGSGPFTGMTPFMALKQMSEEQGYDPDVVKRLVYLLSDALPKEQVKSGSGG